MKIRNIRLKKSMKFSTLLLTAMLIAAANALVFYSLSMTSTVDVYGANVYFVKGADNGTASVTISSDRTVAQLTTLRAYPNATTTYEDPIKVRNNHTSLPYSIRLRHVSISGSATDFVFVNFTLMGTTQLSLNYTASDSTWNLPDPQSTTWMSISNSTEWSIKVETKAKAGATTGTVNIEIAVDIE